METSVLCADPLEKYYFKHEREIIGGVEVTPITEENVEEYPSIVDRFFTRYYFIKPGAEAVPYQVLFHSNRICLICLAPEHPAFKLGINSISFDVGNADRSKNSVKGKGKKGGMPLQADSTLALLTTNCGKTYKIPSCIRGKLVEVNVDLVRNPATLLFAAEGEGYFAVVLPKPEHCDELKAGLMTQQQYDEFIKSKVDLNATSESNEASESLNDNAN